MAKLTDKQWLEIKTKYQAGYKVRDIASDYNYDAGNISRKAKKEGWIQGELQQDIHNKANAISDLIGAEKCLQQKLQQNQHEIVNAEVLNLAGLKNKAKDVQHSILEILHLTAQQVKDVIQNNPDGVYIKSRGESIQYGRNSEFVKDLIPAMNASNAILGIGKESTAIQINNEQSKDDKVVINIIGE